MTAAFHRSATRAEKPPVLSPNAINLVLKKAGLRRSVTSGSLSWGRRGTRGYKVQAGVNAAAALVSWERELGDDPSTAAQMLTRIEEVLSKRGYSVARANDRAVEAVDGGFVAVYFTEV